MRRLLSSTKHLKVARIELLNFWNFELYVIWYIGYANFGFHILMLLFIRDEFQSVVQETLIGQNSSVV